MNNRVVSLSGLQKQLNLSNPQNMFMLNPTCTGREILGRNNQVVGLHSVKHVQKKVLMENQRRITQGNRLNRCRIRHVLL